MPNGRVIQVGLAFLDVLSHFSTFRIFGSALEGQKVETFI